MEWDPGPGKTRHHLLQSRRAWELGLAELGVPVPLIPAGHSRPVQGAGHLPGWSLLSCPVSNPPPRKQEGFGFPVWNPGFPCLESMPRRAGPCSPRRPFTVWGGVFCPAAGTAPELHHVGNEIWALIPSLGAPGEHLGAPGEHLGTLSLVDPEVTQPLVEHWKISHRFITDLLQICCQGTSLEFPSRAVGAADGPSALLASQRDPRWLRVSSKPSVCPGRARCWGHPGVHLLAWV